MWRLQLYAYTGILLHGGEVLSKERGTNFLPALGASYLCNAPYLYKARHFAHHSLGHVFHVPRDQYTPPGEILVNIKSRVVYLLTSIVLFCSWICLRCCSTTDFCIISDRLRATGDWPPGPVLNRCTVDILDYYILWLALITSSLSPTATSPSQQDDTKMYLIFRRKVRENGIQFVNINILFYIGWISVKNKLTNHSAEKLPTW